MTRITIDVETGPAHAAIRALAAEMQDITPAMDEIGAMLVTSVQARFEAETGPDGARWIPSRRALKDGGKTLRDTGWLVQSLTHRAGPDGVAVGTNVEYAAIHQFGGEIKQEARTQVLAFAARGGRFASRKSTRARRSGVVPIAIAEIGARTITMPARPFLGLDEADEDGIAAIVADHLLEALS